MTPAAGDILHLQFDPASGKEMKGDHFCLTLTPTEFNRKFGLCWVVPITTGQQNAARGLTTITLMGTGSKVTGIALAHQIKALDWAARRAAKVDRIPKSVLNEALEVCGAILNPEFR